MILRPESSLFPCVDAVTVGAQQAQITFIGFPVFKSIAPSPLPLWRSDLFSWVDMVYLKGANVVKTATNTFAAKLFDEIKFPAPIAWPFMLFVGVLLPVYITAIIAAKSLLFPLAGFATFLAFTVFAPAIFKITLLTAILACSFFKPIGVHFISFSAIWAAQFYWLLSHVFMITKYAVISKEKYFDIACKRIEEAYKQPDLFIEQERQVYTQEELL